jgi:tetratricopeptide (TPR) repeat protein
MVRESGPWMVKSSGRVLGPFPAATINELLRTREISVLDEISSPMRRWQTIQYHTEFKEVIDHLRRSNVSDKTEASWSPGTATANMTQTLTDALTSDLTSELDNAGTFTPTAKEIVIHNIPESPSNSHAAAAGRFQPAQNQNVAIQRQVEKTTRGMWIVTILVLAGVAFFIAQKKFTRLSLDAHFTPGSMKQNVTALLQTGQYAEALRELKSFYPDPNQAGDMAIYYGSLLIDVEGQTVVGRRLLNSVIAKHRPEIKQAYTGLGVADLLDVQLDSAEDNFNKALAIDNSFVPAVVGSAAVALQKGDYPKAKSIAERALLLSPLQGEAILILAEAQLYLFKRDGDAQGLAHVSRRLKEFRAKQWDYSSEVGFYSLYFDYYLQDKMLDDKLREYLDSDPQLTTDHRHNVFIYKGHAQWKILGKFCAEMGAKLPDSPKVSALLAACSSHEQAWDQSRKHIEKATQQAPHDALVQAWLSYILKENSDPDQASVVLARATELNRKGEYVLPNLLQAKFCAAAQLVDCARDSWQRIYERDLDYLPAISGLAWVNAQKGFHNESSKLLEKGLKISPDYIPLLQLKQKAEREGWYVAN